MKENIKSNFHNKTKPNICFIFLPFAYYGNPSTESGPKNLKQYYFGNLRSKYEPYFNITVFEVENSYDIKKLLGKELTSAIGDTLKKFDLCFAFGGNHLSLLPVYQAFAEVEKSLVLSFDAHRDVYEAENKITHASFLRFLSLERKSKLIGIGYRDFFVHQDIEKFYDEQFSIFELKEFENYLRGLEFLLFDSIHLDFDLDVFDPHLFPYTPTKMSFGLDFTTTLNLLHFLPNDKFKVISFSEYDPTHDYENLGCGFIYRLVDYFLTNMIRQNSSYKY